MEASGSQMAQIDAEALYAKGAKAELGKSYDVAFRAYVDAATAFLGLSRAAGDARTQARLRAQAGKALERAERIKAVKSGLTPVVRDPLAEDEQRLVLRRGSRVNGLHVPLWEDGGGDLGSGGAGGIYTDPDGPLKLSAEQLRQSTVWRRPRDVFGEITLRPAEIDPREIVQRVIEDCSLCTSLAVCLGHNGRYRAKKILPPLYPCDSDGQPICSPTGRYDLKVWFNGAHRRVTIDDRLPFDADGRPMCLSTLQRSEMWPSLVEKAYLKLMGGYDFPGSNSSIDIHTLAGWIPDHIEIRGPLFRREHTWLEILHSFQRGESILTAGTGNRPSTSWGNINLLTAHSYAITDLREDDNGERWLTIFDTWKSRQTEQTLDDALGRLSLDSEELGRVDMTWDEVCNVFDSVYISLDPGVFEHAVHFHGTWRPSRLSDAEKEDSSQQVLRLRFEQSSTQIPQKDEVWILLTRHRIDTRKVDDYISLHAEQTGVSVKSNAATVPSDRPAGVYTNSPHFLVKTSLTEISSGILTTALYDGTSDDVGFTLTAYSSLPMRWESAVEKLPFDQKVIGSLTSRTSGGNHTLPSYMFNPQYHMKVPETRGGPRKKARVLFTARSAKELPLNITVVWGQGKRVSDLIPNDVASNSGPYSYGFAHAEAALLPGDYTVVVSTFEANQPGPFSLRLESSHDVQLQAIPQEGAGMFLKTVRGRWSGESAGGSAKSRSYPSKPLFELRVPCPSQIMVRLQPLSKSTFVNVSVFSAPGTSRHLDKLLVSSGAYEDAISGAVTPLTAVAAGRYIIVPSTYDVGVEADFRIFVYSSKTSVDVTPL